MAELKAFYDNFSYIFVPFSFKNADDFHELVDRLDKTADWTRAQDKIRYMFKFVTDKLNGENPQDCRSVHFCLTDQAAEKAGIRLADAVYATEEKTYRGRKTAFCFQILEAHLFCFSTSVCMLAFRLHFSTNDPYKIAAAQYYLRKIWSEKVSADGGEPFTLLELSARLLGNWDEKYAPDLFFHANDNTERANFLTYLNIPAQESYEKELFYLKWCYHDQFSYYDDTALGDSEIYKASTDITWGVSSSAAVCLVNADDDRGDFLRGTFYKNFCAEYLFMYVLLLHQKYMMYLLLTKIGVGMNNNLELLEAYKQELYEFETDFVFSHITEVPQYQRLYEKIEKVFALKAMFNDIHEPITALAEVRREESEKQEKQRDAGITVALFILSALTVVSALTDAFGMVENLGWWLNDTVQHIIQFCGAGGVLLMTVVCIVIWIRSRKK